MKSVHLFFVLASLFSAISAHAFNKDRCGTLFPKMDDTHPPYYAPIYVFTMFPSTSSYFSSLGPCSMYGNSSGSLPRAQFLEKSLDPLKVDAARGSGEYLNALAELSGCSSDKYPAFAKSVHSNFKDIFVAGDSAALAGRIDNASRGICVLKPVAVHKSTPNAYESE